MGGISIWQLLIIAVIVILLFGTKKLRRAGDVLFFFGVAFQHYLLWLPSVGTRSWCFAVSFNNLPLETSTLQLLGLFITSWSWVSCHAGDVLIIFGVAFQHYLLWLPSVGTRSWCFATSFNNLPFETNTLQLLGLFTTSWSWVSCHAGDVLIIFGVAFQH